MYVDILRCLIRTLLQRNNLWDNAVENYVISVLYKFCNCKTASLAIPSSKVSLISPSRSFNGIVCIDHFFVDQLRSLNLMDSVSRYSAYFIADSATLITVIGSIESFCLSPFCQSLAIKGDDSIRIFSPLFFPA